MLTFNLLSDGAPAQFERTIDYKSIFYIDYKDAQIYKSKVIFCNTNTK